MAKKAWNCEDVRYETPFVPTFDSIKSEPATFRAKFKIKKLFAEKAEAEPYELENSVNSNNIYFWKAIVRQYYLIAMRALFRITTQSL